MRVTVSFLLAITRRTGPCLIRHGGQDMKPKLYNVSSDGPTVRYVCRHDPKSSEGKTLLHFLSEPDPPADIFITAYDHFLIIATKSRWEQREPWQVFFESADISVDPGGRMANRTWVELRCVGEGVFCGGLDYRSGWQSGTGIVSWESDADVFVSQQRLFCTENALPVLAQYWAHTTFVEMGGSEIIHSSPKYIS